MAPFGTPVARRSRISRSRRVSSGSLALVVAAWRGSRRAVPGLLVLRALSALAAVPAVITPGVPGAVAAVAVALPRAPADVEGAAEVVHA